MAASLLLVRVAFATPPSTPIQVEVSLSGVSALDLQEPAELRIEVRSLFDAPGTHVEVILPEGATAATPDWTVDLDAGVPVTLGTQVLIREPGNHAIGARALRVGPGGESWSDAKVVQLHAAPSFARMSWLVDHVPVARLTQPGDTAPVSMASTPFQFQLPKARAEPSSRPAVEPARLPQPPAVPLQTQAAVTLTGRWRYHDRSGVTRDVDQQLIEIRTSTGGELSPQEFCFTEVNGDFSCTFTHPGTDMRVWVRSYTDFELPGGGSDRLGVFEGNELDCGSDAIECSYPLQTGVISCAPGATCNVGTWTVMTSFGEPWLGAHQMTQDLVRSWKKIFFDDRFPADTSAGPGRINYPVPSEHGTHAHVPPQDGWISIEPDNQQSGDVVNHEYGHVVMANLWDGQGFTPNWPTSDCPSPHFIQQASGPGCALSEGFANFWAWYSNEFYDGDNVTTNDGPIWNFAGGGQENFEIRAGFESGDQVEGNVAAVLGDFLDAAGEGPPPDDRLADGVRNIWHTTYVQSDNNFAEWWQAYWSTLGFPSGFALEILMRNSICEHFAIVSGQAQFENLESSDCETPNRTSTGLEADFYEFFGLASQRVTIALTSSSIDTYLNLIGPNATVVAQDDDGGPGLNSLISSFPLPSSGTYFIETTSFGAGDVGAYGVSLTICGDGVVHGSEQCDDGNTLSGDCCSPTCSFEPNGSPCNDGLFCTGTDTCNSLGSCAVHSGDPCPGGDGDGDCSESCSEATNSCTAFDPSGSACSDGLFCNGTDLCNAGSCVVHSGDPCPGGDGDGDCSESCSEGTNSCTAFDPSGSACSDGLFCNGSDTCNTLGSCAFHLGDPCPGPDGDGDCSESCSEASDSCTAFDPDGSGCSDGLFCNGAETCSSGAGGCVPGTPPNCSDGIACTTDSCDEAAQSCGHVPLDASCDDGLFCNGSETCDSGIGCVAGTEPCPLGEDCDEAAQMCSLLTCEESASLPVPQIEADTVVDKDGFTLYWLAVTNASVYPAALFAPSPDLPPCGLNPNSARTWVQVHDADGVFLSGFCAVTLPEELERFWFPVFDGSPVPPFVSLRFIDRRCDLVLESSLLSTRCAAAFHPGEPDANGNGQLDSCETSIDTLPGPMGPLMAAALLLVTLAFVATARRLRSRAG